MGRKRTSLFDSSMSKSSSKLLVGCLTAPIVLPIRALQKSIKKKTRKTRRRK